LGLRVPVSLEPWPDDEPALIGINSFGFGGTNAHAVVGEYRSEPALTNVIRIARDAPAEALVGSPPPVTDARSPATTAGEVRDMPLVISARSEEALRLLV